MERKEHGEASTLTIDTPPDDYPSMPFENLSEVELRLVLEFVESDTLVVCTEVCHFLATALDKDKLWQRRCIEDWGESRKVLPANRRTSTCPTYLKAWRGWRRAFNGYKSASVKRVAVWWAGIEEWMHRELPEVEASLNQGVTEAELNRAEEVLGWPLPTDLRLLYRFHNGQWLPWDHNLDHTLGVDEGKPGNPPNFTCSGIETRVFMHVTETNDAGYTARKMEWSLGLLGGYCFYNRNTTCKLFSLQRGVLSGVAACNAMDGEHGGYFRANALRWETDLETVRARGGFLLAASADNMSKRAWVGRDGNVRFDPKVGSLLGVINAAPIAPPRKGRDGPSVVAQEHDNAAVDDDDNDGLLLNDDEEGRQHGGNLMAWLEEYLRRLQARHYVVKARWRDRYDFGDDPIGPGGQPLADGAFASGRLARGVWLFPEMASAESVTTVTKGVEVQVSPVLVPEECSEWKELLWAYSVKIQLLRDDPSRPQSMVSCQLSTRHWEIDSSDGLHREVSGDGVIGLYPLLRIPESSPGPMEHNLEPFEYQSCTGIESPPGTMGGRFTFIPGTKEHPTGRPFDARVPHFTLAVPKFIF